MKQCQCAAAPRAVGGCRGRGQLDARQKVLPTRAGHDRALARTPDLCELLLVLRVVALEGRRLLDLQRLVGTDSASGRAGRGPSGWAFRCTPSYGGSAQLPEMSNARVCFRRGLTRRMALNILHALVGRMFPKNPDWSFLAEKLRLQPSNFSKTTPARTTRWMKHIMAQTKMTVKVCVCRP